MSSTACSAESRQRGERRGPADERREVVDRPRLQRHHRDDLLGEHVQRVARVAHRLDRAGRHPLGDHRARRRGRRGTWGRPRRGTPRRPGARPGRPAAARRPRRRRLDLHDQVDRAHVDAQLEARRGDDAGQPPGLELLLDERPLLAGHRAVVRPRDHRRARRRCRRPDCADRLGRRRAASAGRVVLPAGSLGRQLVEPRASAARPAAASWRTRSSSGAPGSGRARRSSTVRPDRRPLRGPAAEPTTSSSDVAGAALAERGHVLDRHHDRRPRSSWRSAAARPRTGRPPAEERRHLVERADGRRQPDPLGRPRRAARRAAPATAPGARRAWSPATACTSSTITVSTPRSDSRAGRGEQQEQRLGRGDQDVGRRAGERPALVGRGVAGAHADRDVGRRLRRAGAAACRMPASGARRLRSTSTASALSGET